MSIDKQNDSQGTGGPPAFVEQRRSPRYPVFLDALVTGEGFESRACKIRDFCATGIFLSFEGEAGAVTFASQRPIQPDDRLGIHFFTTVGDLDASFDLEARVVRVLTSGIGAELISPDPMAIEALARVAKVPVPMVRVQPAPQAAAAGRDEHRVERMALLRELRARLDRSYDSWMMRLFNGMEIVFLNASRDTPDAMLQRSIWQAGQILKEKRKSIIAELHAGILEIFDTAATGGVKERSKEGAAQGTGTSSDLSLVETDEFEQFLAVSEGVDKAETALSRAMFELNQRLSFLFAARIDKGNNPVGAASLARHFGNHIRRLRLGVEPLRTALRAFHDLVVPEIQNFYEDTNRFLADSGVPLIGETPRPRVTRSAPAPRRPPASPASPASPATTATTATTAPAAPAATMEDVAQQIHQLASTLPPGTPLMVAPVSAFQAAHTLFGLGRDLFRTVPGAVEAPAAAEATGGGVAYYNTAELAAALKALELTAGDSSAGMLTAQALRARLESLLAAQSPAAAGVKVVKDTDWDLLELVLELFNAILKDPHVIPEVRPHLRKLCRPVNMLALNDSGFFNDVSHPARRVINKLAQIRSVAVDEGRESVLPRIDFIVDRVANEAPERPEVFAEADVELEAILTEQERAAQDNLAELVRAAEAQQQFLKARRKEESAEARMASSSSLSGDWLAWLNRARRLQVGDELLLGSGTQQRLARVAWISDDANSYVFADPTGRKVGSFGAQELAMQLRRGTAKIIEDLQLPTVERAMLKSLESLHGRLEQQVHSDAITSLLNEKAFNEALEQALLQARQDKESHTLALIGVDEAATAKQTGANREERLRELAARFRGVLPEEAVAARLGEDQFGLLVRDCSQGKGYALLEKVIAALQGDASLPESGSSVKARAGLVPFGAEALTAARVLKAAQSALALARGASSSAIRIVHVEEDGAAGMRVSSRLTEQLQAALDGDRLQLAVQRVAPQTQLPSAGLPTHIELMPSMQLEGGVRVSAKALRIAAEQLQRSIDLDRWFVRAVMRWVVDHPERLPTQGLCIVSLSQASLKDASLPAFISEQFINIAAPPSRFCFEVTEDDKQQAHPEVEELVYALREFGCRFVYGDFGGESSSFSRVKTLKVDMVRIGRMQSRDIVGDRGDAALVKSVVEMAHFFGVPAIADNINSKPALAKLRELGIDYAQGMAVSPVELAI